MGAARQPCKLLKMDWRHLQTRRLSLSLIVGATLSAAAARPLAELEGQSPLNLNIRSLWFEALGCSAPGVRLKGKRDSRVPGAHRKITPHGKLVFCRLPLNLNALKQTVALEQQPRCEGKNKETMEEERERETEGEGGQGRGREKSKTST